MHNPLPLSLILFIYILLFIAKMDWSEAYKPLFESTFLDSSGGSFSTRYPNTTGYHKNDDEDDYDDEAEAGALVIKEEFPPEAMESALFSGYPSQPPVNITTSNSSASTTCKFLN